MPLYEYVCKDCGSHFDVLRTFKDADKSITCKSCLSAQTVRAISVFYAQSDGRSVTASSGCAGCGGGSCASCGSHHN